MTRQDITRIRDLPTSQIEAALTMSGADLKLDQLLAIERFIEQIGGLENARLAMDTLRKIERAELLAALEDDAA